MKLNQRYWPGAAVRKVKAVHKKFKELYDFVEIDLRHTAGSINDQGNIHGRLASWEVKGKQESIQFKGK